MSYQRSYLDKLIAQDFNITYAAARMAVNRYMVESYQAPVPWWQMLPGDPFSISEWIVGTSRYWVPRGKNWSIKMEGD